MEINKHDPLGAFKYPAFAGPGNKARYEETWYIAATDTRHGIQLFLSIGIDNPGKMDCGFEPSAFIIWGVVDGSNRWSNISQPSIHSIDRFDAKPDTLDVRIGSLVHLYRIDHKSIRIVAKIEGISLGMTIFHGLIPSVSDTRIFPDTGVSAMFCIPACFATMIGDITLPGRQPIRVRDGRGFLGHQWGIDDIEEPMTVAWTIGDTTPVIFIRAGNNVMVWCYVDHTWYKTSRVVYQFEWATDKDNGIDYPSKIHVSPVDKDGVDFTIRETGENRWIGNAGTPDRPWFIVKSLDYVIDGKVLKDGATVRDFSSPASLEHF
jgi:hypothetical protein